MSYPRLALLLWLALSSSLPASDALGQAASPAYDSVLNAKVDRFEVVNRTMQESLVQLSSERLPVTLGFEGVLKEKTADAPRAEPRFSLRLENKTVREILNALCAMDDRFTWSQDAFGANVFPRATIRDASYFLNRKIDKLEFHNISDAYQALTPLARHFPNEQIAYSHLGGDVSLAPPWTETFQDLTVRQMLNRIAAQLGPFGGWMFYGSKDLRWFNFHKMPYSPLDPSGP